MSSIEIEGQTFEISLKSQDNELVLTAFGQQRITLRESDEPCSEIRSGMVPSKAHAFLESFLKNRDSLLNRAREETVLQLWDDYDDGWREAGNTNAPDQRAFANALGRALFFVSVDKNGTPCMAEIWWENTELFLGHSILVQVFDPENWTDLYVTIFG